MTHRPFGPWSDNSTMIIATMRIIFGGALLAAAFGLWMAS